MSILYYIAAVLTDGDWSNDWLSHMSPDVAELMMNIGRTISLWIGG